MRLRNKGLRVKGMAEKTKAWDSYWANNNSTNSFEFDYSATDGPYGSINNFWQEVFQKFTKNEIVADLGAGNGALANLFVQSRKQLNCQKWINIDSANTKAVIKHKQVHYKQDNIEELSLLDASIDHFISMFGLEYAHLTKSLIHIKRCLKEYGQFHFIMHHKDSVISSQSALTIEVFEGIIASGLLHNLGQLKDHTSLKRHLLTGLNKELHSRASKYHDDVKLIGENIYFILKSTTNIAVCIKHLQYLLEDLQLQIIRLQQQLSAADQVTTIKEQLQSYGFSKCSLKELKYNNDILAWVLIGSKNTSKPRNENA